MVKYYFIAVATVIVAGMAAAIYLAQTENTVGMLNIFDPSVVMEISKEKSLIQAEKKNLDKVKMKKIKS